MAMRPTGIVLRIVLGLLAAAGLWWLAKRAWLFFQGTEAEPPALPAPDPSPEDASGVSSPDPVDEAIDESFPASDPPSYAGARGGNGDEGSGTRPR